MDISDDLLIAAYLQVGIPLDQLAHTPDLDRLIRLADPHACLDERFRRDTNRRLTYLRKRGRLPRLGRGGPMN